MRESMSPKEKLDANTRRRLVEAALSGAEKKALAEEHGISRRWLYDLLEDATEDPEGKLAEAEAEADFRRKVLEILKAREPQR